MVGDYSSILVLVGFVMFGLIAFRSHGAVQGSRWLRPSFVINDAFDGVTQNVDQQGRITTQLNTQLGVGLDLCVYNKKAPSDGGIQTGDLDFDYLVVTKGHKKQRILMLLGPEVRACILELGRVCHQTPVDGVHVSITDAEILFQPGRFFPKRPNDKEIIEVLMAQRHLAIALERATAPLVG